MSIHEISTQRDDDEGRELVEPIEVPRSSAVGRFLREIRRRRVGRAAMTYALVVWLNLQVADISFPLLGLPEWSMPLVMMLGLLGFPLVLALAWVFQITPQGIVVDCVNGTSDGGGSRVDTGLNAGLLLFGGVLVVVTTVQLTTTVAAETRSLGAASGSTGSVVLVVRPSKVLADQQGNTPTRLIDELRHQIIAAPHVTLVENTEGNSKGSVLLSISIHDEGAKTRIIATALDKSAAKYLYTDAFVIPAQRSAELDRRFARQIVTGLGAALSR